MKDVVVLCDTICQACPNGCHLSAVIRDDGVIEVSGHQCEKGVVFARSQMAKISSSPERLSPVIASSAQPSYSFPGLAEIARAWGLSLKQTHPEIDVQGSPERTAYRIVVEDEEARLWVMEEIHRRELVRKQQIIDCLDTLVGQGLDFLPRYQESLSKEKIVATAKDSFWQLQPFLPGVSLDRERYLHDQWRGPVLAEFLLKLRQKSSGVSLPVGPDVFSITKYIATLAQQIRQRRPDVSKRLTPVLDFLGKEFWSAQDHLPVCFCHGDYHPLNIIWAPRGIRAVIDWEFSGIKPEIYDISNMIGCLGMEHPSALTGDLVLSFIERLRAGQAVAGASWQYLPEFVVALRFAWLAQWLRKQDEEMVAQELVYMGLLVEHRSLLREEWGICSASVPGKNF